MSLLLTCLYVTVHLCCQMHKRKEYTDQERSERKSKRRKAKERKNGREDLRKFFSEQRKELNVLYNWATKENGQKIILQSKLPENKCIDTKVVKVRPRECQIPLNSINYTFYLQLEIAVYVESGTIGTDILDCLAEFTGLPPHNQWNPSDYLELTKQFIDPWKSRENGYILIPRNEMSTYFLAGGYSKVSYKLCLSESFGIHVALEFLSVCSSSMETMLLSSFRYLVLAFLGYDRLHTFAHILNGKNEASLYEQLMKDVERFRPRISPENDMVDVIV